jgi:uncharacterized damage-inducible protein DinB
MFRDDDGFPHANDDDKELLLEWLGYLRGAVLRNVEGIDDEQAQWTPDGKLISLVGIVNHLTRVEWRWIDGAFDGVVVDRDEGEFSPIDLPIADAIAAYRARARTTDAAVRAMSLRQQCAPDGWAADGRKDLRWVLVHLINETARHAGHADATRELLDGTTGE